ncbi:MAG: CvpA family protein [Bacteroidota bacterium]
MNFIDVVITVPLIYAGYRGFKNGLIIEVFTLLALFVGLYSGIHFSDFIASKLKEVFSWDSPYAPTICFTLIFLGIGAMVYFAGITIQKMVNVVKLSPLDKFFGIFFAVLKMTYFLSIVLVLLDSYDEKGDFFPNDKKEGSLLYAPVKGVATLTVPGLSNSTIFIRNAFKEEADNSGLTVEEVLRTKEVADSLGLEANDSDEIKMIYEKYVAKAPR